jgi:hypothetical protein
MVICILNTGYEVSLEPRKVYEVLRDPAAAKHRQLRVVDESGEDYLYPESHFAEIVVPQSVRLSALGLGKELHVRQPVEVLVLGPHHSVDCKAGCIDDAICQRELVVGPGFGGGHS